MSEAIVRSTVTLSERYITDRFLPDKAIDLLDEACACCSLRHPEITEWVENEKHLAGLKAVSYTHLDVYKRQCPAPAAPGRAAELDRRFLCGQRTTGKIMSSSTQRTAIVWSAGAKPSWCGLTPVSYTHLDVYKRQGLFG